MDQSNPNNELVEKFPLLAKGGESGQKIINKNWAESSLGGIEKWPRELSVSLCIMLYSSIPMFLLWGKNFILFYNDAYRNSKDFDEKKMGAIGICARESNIELWKILHTQIEKIVFKNPPKAKNPGTESDLLINDNFYSKFTLTPVPATNDEVEGIMGIYNSGSTNEDNLRKKSESLLDEERLKLAVEVSGIATWELNLINDDITYSEKFSEILGHDISKKLTPSLIRKQVYPSDEYLIHEAFKNALTTGRYDYEVRVIRPDNSIIYIRVMSKLFQDESGKPIKLIGTTRDITSERQDHKALERSERRLRRLILNAPIAIAILTGPDYIVEIINERALKLMGKTKEQMLNKPVLDSITELDPAATKNLLDSVYYSGKPFSAYEFPVRLNRFGQIEKVFINFEYHPLYNSQGKIYGIMVVGIDVTDQVVARHKIEESEARFKLLADSMPQFVWSADKNGIINYFNQAVYDYSGLTQKDVQEGGWLKIVHPDEISVTIKHWKRAVATGKDFSMEHRFRRYDGQYRWQLSRAIPLSDESGHIQQWIGTSTDIQNMKLQEQHKDFFISMASHELKTPITSMKGYIQILQSMYQDNQDEFLKTSLDRIHTQIEKLIAIIADLLDVSKIRTGSLTFNKQDFDLNLLLKEVIEELTVVYPNFKINFSPASEIRVYADRDRVGQVFVNLISNAIKYSPKSRDIYISSKMNARSVMISVKDEGIGIDKNFQRKIFERFYRVEGKSEKTFPGFGIGLFIASEIIRRHKGSIGVESEPGKGSRFYFSLPLAKK
jgi:PAS domain S-box-containing protein